MKKLNPYLLLFLAGTSLMVAGQHNPNLNEEYVYDQVDELEDEDYTPIINEGFKSREDKLPAQASPQFYLNERADQINVYEFQTVGKKLIPQAGWVPLTTSTFGGQIPLFKSANQKFDASPRSSNGNSKPIQFPQPVFGSKPAASNQDKQNVVSLFKSNSQFPPQISHKPHPKNVFISTNPNNLHSGEPTVVSHSADPVNYNSGDSAINQIESVADHNNFFALASQRSERAVLKNNGAGDGGHETGDSSLIARIESLECEGEVEKLLIEILESPQRDRNSVLAFLRGKLSKKGPVPTPAPPTGSPSGTTKSNSNKEVIQATFSNNFPGFQQKQTIKEVEFTTQRTNFQSETPPPQRQEKALQNKVPASQIQNIVNNNQIPRHQQDQQQQLLQQEQQKQKLQQEQIRQQQQQQQQRALQPQPQQQLQPPTQPGFIPNPNNNRVNNNNQFDEEEENQQAEEEEEPRTQAPRRLAPTQVVLNEDQVTEANRAHFSIEQFLQRYPEVKRVSSRFNDGKSGPPENNFNDDFAKEAEKPRTSFPTNSNNDINGQQQQKRPPTPVAPPPSTTLRTTTLTPRLTPPPTRPQTPPSPPTRPQTPPPPPPTRPQPPPPTQPPTRPPTQPPTRPSTQPPTRPPTQPPTRPPPPPPPPPAKPPTQPPTRLAPPPSKPNPPPTPSQSKVTPRPVSQPVRQTVPPPTFAQQQDTTQSIDFPDYSSGNSNPNPVSQAGKGGQTEEGELSSDDYSYLYYEEYYEELVPEHHRFLQLEASTSNPKNGNRPLQPNSSRNPKSQKAGANGNNLVSNGKNVKVKKVKANRNHKNNNNNDVNNDGNFSFFVNHQKDEAKKTPAPNANNFPNFPLAGFAPTKSPAIIQVIQTTQTPASQVLTQPPKPAPIAVSGSGNQAGPFGYVDKGTFFTDERVTEFPEKIEIIYQGFVWALDVGYPTEGNIMHGGVHNVLKDKVKRDTVFLKDDYIVRIEGRASPFNINRMTFFTAKGKQFGPWGDRRSQESIDFDITAPPGHGLAFFSGTIDFGVPLRSISFHWRPIPN